MTKWRDRKDNHDFMQPEHVQNFLRNHNTGVNNLGRLYLASIISQHGPGTTVLDAACGSCVNYEVFKNHHVQCNYTGLDRTEKLLEEAKRRYGNEITFVKGFVQEIPLPEESQDVVILRHILEHLEEGYEIAIKEALRVAKKEVVVVFFLAPHGGPQDQMSESQPDENGCTYWWNTYSWSKFTQFIASLGVQLQVRSVATPGAAHSDTIVRIIK
jgi:ubiquinone/menaquinone biosynthesis C-methylase UbiE